ncbi:MAG: PKD domain-containing protein [Bacteroidota bacterium]
MRRNLFTVLLSTILFSLSVKAECVLVPLSLAERVNASTLIVEARVSNRQSYFNSTGMIQTANTLAVSKVYKGYNLLPSNSFNIITLGGTVGQQSLKVDPELELEIGEIGIFLLIQKDGEWVSESGPQGFVKIDKTDGTASDVFNQYPAFSIYSTIETLTQTKAIEINGETKLLISKKRATATITSISPKTLSAGTTTTLTIKGTNFQSVQDTSTVLFKNSDDGGASYIKAMRKDYISWSDTMIKVIVRSRAGTGKIRVNAGVNGVATSTDTLKISYSHLNVETGYKRDSIAYETQEIGMNAAKGITWTMSAQFYDSVNAKGAFIRSLERWRCGTYINWDTLGKVKYSSIKSDGKNICSWDTSNAMPNGVLAQCFSWWSGCNVTGGQNWFVIDLDIRFRIKPTNTTNWNYSINSASGSQFHFESVATHELGHGHQLGHVIAPAVVMHYAIGNGQVKPSLSTSDIDGGTYIVTKSATSVCGKTAHTKLTSGNCAIVPPSANFGTSRSAICLNENIVVKDSSKGNITAYAWNFGSGASPATASTVGPHTVTYSTGGTKTITLTITTSTGSTLVKTRTINVAADSKMKPNFTWVAAEKGKVTFTNTSNNATTAKWFFTTNDSAVTINSAHQFAAGGTYSIRLIATNTCNTEDTIKNIKIAYLNFYAMPKNACIGQTVTFYDSCDNNVATRQWTFANASPLSANTVGPHAVTYSSAGNKTTTLVITVTGGQNQVYAFPAVVSISTDTFTKASFTYSYLGLNEVAFNSNSNGSNKTYKWYFGDGDSSTLANPQHKYTNANFKVVKLVVKGNCNNDDTTITLRDFTGVKTIAADKYFRLYPNPANSSVTIISEINGAMEFAVTDISGKTVLQGNGNTLVTENLANGVYLVKVVSGNYSGTMRLVVQH